MHNEPTQSGHFESAVTSTLAAAEVVASVRAYRDCLRSCEKVTGQDPYGTVEVLREFFIEAVDEMTSTTLPNKGTLFSHPLDEIHEQAYRYFTEVTFVAADIVHDHPDCVPKPYAVMLGERRKQHDRRVWSMANVVLGTLAKAGLALNGSKTTGSAVLDSVLVEWAQDVLATHTKMNNGPILEVRTPAPPDPLSINLPFQI